MLSMFKRLDGMKIPHKIYLPLNDFTLILRLCRVIDVDDKSCEGKLFHLSEKKNDYIDVSKNIKNVSSI